MSDEIQAALRREREKLGEIAQGRIIVVTAFIEAQARLRPGTRRGKSWARWSRPNRLRATSG
jgi:hypothetical protein